MKTESTKNTGIIGLLIHHGNWQVAIIGIFDQHLQRQRNNSPKENLMRVKYPANDDDMPVQITLHCFATHC